MPIKVFCNCKTTNTKNLQQLSKGNSYFYCNCTWSCCMLVWCPWACSPQCLLLFGSLYVCPLRQPALRLMLPLRTPKRSHSPYPHPHQHWHGNGSKPPSWKHPQIYCHLWTCLWAHAEGVSLTATQQEGKQEAVRRDIEILSSSTSATTVG